MKKRLWVFFIVWILLALTACDTNYPEAPLEHKAQLSVYDQSIEEREIGVQSIISENEWYTLSIHYPVTGFDFIDNQMEQFVNTQIDVYKSEIESIKKNKKNPPKWPYELHLSYDIPFRSNSIIGIQFTKRQSIGDVLSKSEIITFNYDLKKGSNYVLNDILSPSNYNMILYELSLDVLHKNNQLDIIDIIEPSDNLLLNFILTNTELKIWLNPEQLDHQVNAPLAYAIPLSKIMQYLTLNLSPGYALRDDREYLTEKDTSAYPKAVFPEYDLQGDYNRTAGNYKNKKITLTFEGGPHPIYTPIILQTLKDRNVHATFFYMGKRAKEYPDIVTETAALGHDIGNGSYSYPQMLRMSNTMQSFEIDTTQNILENLTGVEPYIFRSPYGQHDAELLKRLNMPIVLWNIDPEDTTYNDPNYITSHVLAYAVDGGIVRLRDSQLGTAQAIGTIIDSLEEAGYQIVPITELLNITPENAPNRLRVFNSKN